MDATIFWGSLLIMLAGVAFLGKLSLYKVSRPDVAVIDRLGKWVRIVRQPGPHLLIPLVETAHMVPGRPQQLDLAVEQAVSSDGYDVEADAHLWYRVRARQDSGGKISNDPHIAALVILRDAAYFYVDQIGDDTKVREFLLPIFKAYIDKTVAQFTAAKLQQEQDVIEESVTQLLNIALNDHGWDAIVVTRVGFENLRAPGYQAAIEQNLTAELSIDAATSEGRAFGLSYQEVLRVTNGDHDAARMLLLRKGLPEGTQLNLFSLGGMTDVITNLFNLQSPQKPSQPESSTRRSLRGSSRPTNSRNRRRTW